MHIDWYSIAVLNIENFAISKQFLIEEVKARGGIELTDFDNSVYMDESDHTDMMTY